MPAPAHPPSAATGAMDRAELPARIEAISKVCPVLPAMFRRLSSISGLRAVAERRFALLTPDDVSKCTPELRMLVFMRAGGDIVRLAVRHAEAEGAEPRLLAQMKRWHIEAEAMFTAARAPLDIDERRNLRGALWTGRRQSELAARSVFWFAAAADDITRAAAGLRPVDPIDLQELRADPPGEAGCTSLGCAINAAWACPPDGALEAQVARILDKAFMHAIATGDFN